MSRIPLEEYENRHHSRFPESKIKISYKKGKYVYFETEFGKCKKLASKLGLSNFSPDSALNKTDYLKSRLIEKYGDKFDFSLVKYESARKHIIVICKIHGKFKTTPNLALSSILSCTKCSNAKMSREYMSNVIEFSNKANLKYNYKYDYSKVKYVNCREKVIIICPIHGEFKKSPNAHLRNEGCQKCARDRIKKANRENSSGWTITDWEKAAKISKKFDSFKVYIIKCWNDEEEFYKIGRTFTTVNRRFKNKNCMPYNYEVLKTYEDTAKNIFNLENNMKRKNKKNKYTPKIQFGGMYECFSKIDEI